MGSLIANGVREDGSMPPLPQTPPTDPYASETIAGLGLRELLVNESSWVHRRVETFEFVDDRTVSRQMSVDFTLPAGNRLVDALFIIERPFVPLTTLRKAPLSHLNVWSEDSTSLPVLTSAQNGRLAGACLFGVARSVVRGSDPQQSTELPDAIADALHHVAMLPAPDAEYLAGCMVHRGAERRPFQMQTWMSHCWDGWKLSASLRDLVAALEPHTDVLAAALDSPILRTLLTELASQFILAVELDRDDIGRRRVVKFAYDEPIAVPGQLGRLPLYAARALYSLSYLPVEYNFTGLAIGKSASHHVEVVAPEQLEVVRMRLDGVTGTSDYKQTADSTGVGRRAHANVAGAPRSATGTITVDLRAERAGLVRGAPLFAALVLGSLILLTIDAKHVENDAAAAMLLVVPGVIAAFIIRPGEHRLATNVMLGIRALVAASALCAFIASAYIATGFKNGALHRHLKPPTWASGCILALLLLSYFLPRRRGP
jgi:hypothetical protein